MKPKPERSRLIALRIIALDYMYRSKTFSKAWARLAERLMKRIENLA